MIDRPLDLVIGQISGAALGGMAFFADKLRSCRGVVALSDTRRQAALSPASARQRRQCYNGRPQTELKTVAPSFGLAAAAGAALANSNLATGWMGCRPDPHRRRRQPISPFIEKGTTTAVRMITTTMVAIMMPLEECCSAMLITSIRKKVQIADYSDLW